MSARVICHSKSYITCLFGSRPRSWKTCPIRNSFLLSHYRLLQDLLSPPPPANPSSTPAEDDKGEIDSSITLSGLTCTYKLPGKIETILFPHQRNGLKWLWSLHCQGKGGILGDDMGLGKTMQICSFLAGLFHSRLIKRVMVVAPKTLLSHWIKELSSMGLADKIRE